MIYKDRFLFVYILTTLTMGILTITKNMSIWVFGLLFMEYIFAITMIPSQEDIMEYDSKQRSKRR